MTKGRPTTYRPEYAAQARHAYQLGACDEDIARHFDIGIATFYRWRHTYPEFASACTIGKEHADSRVELSLYQRAIGYDYIAERSRMFSTWDKPMIETFTRRVLADPRAAALYLRLRKPREWSASEGAKGEGEDLQDLAEILAKGLRRVAEGREPDGEI